MNEKSDKSLSIAVQKAISVLLTVCAVFIAASAVRNIIVNSSIDEKYVSAQGKVNSTIVEKKNSAATKMSYVTFTDENGTTHNSVPVEVSNGEAGDTVMVYYNPDNPDEEVYTKMSLFSMAMPLAFSALVLTAGIVLFCMTSKEKTNEKREEKQ